MLPLWNTLNDTNPRHQWIAFLGFVQEKLMGNKIVWVGVESGGILHVLLPVLICWNHLQGYFCRFSHCYSDYDHVNPQCNINHLERIPNWSKLFHGSTSLACLELKSFSNFSPRPLPRNSVWINRDRYLAFLNIWRLTDSAGVFDTWAPMFCEKPTIVWWSNTAGTSPYVLVETRSPSSGWNLPTSYVCLPEVMQAATATTATRCSVPHVSHYRQVKLTL